MRIISPLPPSKYISTLRYRSESFFHFGIERFTGLYLWRFFYITHHAGHEWNRRYTNEKNAALGFVRSCDDGCQVNFIRFKGALCPGQLLFNGLMFILCAFISGYFNDEVIVSHQGIIYLIYLGGFLLYSLIEPIFESLTERSAEGEQILLARLADPMDPCT